MRDLTVIEPTNTGYSARPPDIPGCVSTGARRKEVERNVREAVELRPEGLRREGYEGPEPSIQSAHVEVKAS